MMMMMVIMIANDNDRNGNDMFHVDILETEVIQRTLLKKKET